MVVAIPAVIMILTLNVAYCLCCYYYPTNVTTFCKACNVHASALTIKVKAMNREFRVQCSTLSPLLKTRSHQRRSTKTSAFGASTLRLNVFRVLALFGFRVKDAVLGE